MKTDRYEKLLLPRSFYERDTPEVAQALLGKLIVRKIGSDYLTARIVETEAYRQDDPASHSFRGKTERNSAMFGPVGHAYVYFTYGNHYCLNIVSRSHEYKAGGVLIRAVEPLEGIEQMLKLRPVPIKMLTNGPGKLTEALKIDRTQNHQDITVPGDLMITESLLSEQFTIGLSPRIGISQAQEVLWRFFITDNPWVSRSTKTIK